MMHLQRMEGQDEEVQDGRGGIREPRGPDQESGAGVTVSSGGRVRCEIDYLLDAQERVAVRV